VTLGVRNPSPMDMRITGLWTSDNSGAPVILNGANAARGNDGDYRVLSWGLTQVFRSFA
jgi:hypothetical protein